MVERGPEKAGVGGPIPSLGINLPWFYLSANYPSECAKISEENFSAVYELGLIISLP